MARGIEAQIADTLLWHMSTFDTDLDIAWPGKPFTPDGNHIVVDVAPSTTRQITLGDEGYNRHAGLFQATVVWQQGAGIIAPVEVASSIGEHFCRGSNLVRGDVTVRLGVAEVKRAYPDGGWLRVPVLVPWFADTSVLDIYAFTTEFTLEFDA